MPNGEGGSPPIELSEKDKEMLNRHVKDLEARSTKSADRQAEKAAPPTEWTFETLPYRVSHEKGSQSSVKRGDKADIVGRGTRHDSHPIGNEKIPLK